MHVLAAGRRYRLIAMIVGLTLLTTPSTVSEPDPQVVADGAECFDRVEDGSNATCSVLYAHIADLLNRVPLSVQPIPAEAPDLARGFTGVPGVEPAWSFHRMSMHPSVSGLSWSEGERRGWPGDPAEPVSLVPGEPLFGYWYFSADTAEFSPVGIGLGEGSAGVMPCLTLEMMLFDDRSGGDLIAHGKTTRTVLTVDAQDDTPLPLSDPCPGSDGAITAADTHELRVEMARIPDSPDTISGMRIDMVWYQFDPSGDPTNENKAVQREWNVRSGPEFRPRIVVPIENPARVMSTDLVEKEGTVGVSARFMSPWGPYEFIDDTIDTSRHEPDPTKTAASLRFKVFDEAWEEVSATTVSDPHLRYYFGHQIGDDLLNVTYLWRPGEEAGLTTGMYTMVIEADNLQRTATARAEFVYEHAPAVSQQSPMPGMLLVMFALLGLLALTRRRGS